MTSRRVSQVSAERITSVGSMERCVPRPVQRPVQSVPRQSPESRLPGRFAAQPQESGECDRRDRLWKPQQPGDELVVGLAVSVVLDGVGSSAAIEDATADLLESTASHPTVKGRTNSCSKHPRRQHILDSCYAIDPAIHPLIQRSTRRPGSSSIDQRSSRRRACIRREAGH